MIYLIIFSIAQGLLNTALLLIILFKKFQIKKHTEVLGKNIIAGIQGDKMKGPSVFNVRAFVDGGLVVMLVVIAMSAFVVTREMVPQETVVKQKPISIGNKVYQCRPIKERIIQYYDLSTEKTKPIEIKKECQK